MVNVMAQEQWHNVLRIVHLPGGLRATNPPGPMFEISPVTSKGKLTFQLPKYPELQTTLKNIGLKTLGIEFYQDKSQVEGHFPPTWRPFHMRDKEGWPVTEAELIWSELGHAGFDRGDYEFFDLSQRVKFEIQGCSWRLFDLSNAYNRELTSLCSRCKFKDGNRFQTLNTFFIFLSTHACIIEMSTLRDYLAEFMAKFIFQKYASEGMRVRKMSTLRKKILRQAKSDDALANEVALITDESENNGWLARLSAYRDLIVHYAPLATAIRKGFLVQKLIHTENGNELPSVSMFLPPDPYLVKKVRSKGAQFQDIDEWIHASMSTDSIKQGNVDALNYCHEALGKMAALAVNVAKRSPVSPKSTVIKEEDLIGPVVINES